MSSRLLICRLNSCHEKDGLAYKTTGHRKLEEWGMMSQPTIPVCGKERQEDEELKVILGHIASLRAAWATFDLSQGPKED